ncbi:MAG: MBL fold metallo-hydrolase [Candidatus Heimdallarchaeota archaeon]|nr:MBL fold metallo-hydrolase [Candidatus Heimdallarchaeota archaeon]
MIPKLNIYSIAIIGVLVAGSAVAITYVVMNNEDLTINLLENAGVMIEAENTRIYIDPYLLPDNYSDYPADAILITHNHGDHFDQSSIAKITTEDTQLVLPNSMSYYIDQLGAMGVQPLDTFSVGVFDIECFYMYTESSHLRTSNYTSFLVEYNGFTIFHAGDSYNIPEYTQLSGRVDLALLPLGPGCQTMANIDVVTVLDILQAEYFIPIHFTDKANFITLFADDILDCDCTLIDLEYFSVYTFEL